MDEEKHIKLQNLIREYLPDPKEIKIVSDLKESIGINRVYFYGFKLNHIYEGYALRAGFDSWKEYKESVLDDSNNIKEAKQISTENISKKYRKLKMNNFNFLKLFRTRIAIFVYLKEIPEGFVPQLLEEDKYRDILFHKNTILQLLPHPSRSDLGILRFFSDDLISQGNKKDIIPKNIYMNSIVISLDMNIPDHIISIDGIPDDCKQYKSNFTIPNEFYNPDELFHNIGKIYQGGVYGRSKK